MNQEVISQLIRDQRLIRLPESYIHREIESELLRLRYNPHIIVIKGMRRCGKSTVLQWLRSHEAEAHHYVNFDDDRMVNFNVDDFQLLLELLFEQSGPAKTFFFDEIQNIEGWERFVRRLHDQDYKIYITGSNARLFSRELGTHLTGRTISVDMFPYSFREYLSARKYILVDSKVKSTEEKSLIKKYFNDYTKMGGIPDYIHFEQPEYLNDLYDSILYRDIIVRHHVGKEQSIKSLVYYLASNVGKEVSYNKLKNLLKLASATTVSDYCYFIESSYLCFFISQYSASLKVQAHYGKKEYFIDQALAQKIGFRTSEDRGRLLENIVFLELKRRKYEIYFHKNKKECDFLIKENQKIVQALQVVSHMDNEDTKRREVEGLREAMTMYQLKKGYILTENTEYIENDIIVIPVWKWLLGEIGV